MAGPLVCTAAEDMLRAAGDSQLDGGSYLMAGVEEEEVVVER
jgi:hypothetical protein